MSLFQIEIAGVLFVPVFVIAYLIGWVISRRRPNFLKIALWSAVAGVVSAVLGIVAAKALFFWMMEDKVVDNYSKPLTVEQARQENCPIPLPDSARHVQFVYASGGLQALEILVRFEAPVDVCRGHIAIVFGANQPAVLPLQLTPIKSTPAPEDHDMVGRATWFDVERIKNGTSTGPAGDWEPQIWIDEDRGIFYYKLTD